MTVVPIAGLLGIAAMGHSQPSRSSLPGPVPMSTLPYVRRGALGLGVRGAIGAVTASASVRLQESGPQRVGVKTKGIIYLT